MGVAAGEKADGGGFRLLRAAQCSVLIISLKPSVKWEEAYERLKQEGVEAKSDLEVVLEIAF